MSIHYVILMNITHNMFLLNYMLWVVIRITSETMFLWQLSGTDKKGIWR